METNNAISKDATKATQEIFANIEEVLNGNCCYLLDELLSLKLVFSFDFEPTILRDCIKSIHVKAVLFDDEADMNNHHHILKSLFSQKNKRIVYVLPVIQCKLHKKESIGIIFHELYHCIMHNCYKTDRYNSLMTQADSMHDENKESTTYGCLSKCLYYISESEIDNRCMEIWYSIRKNKIDSIGDSVNMHVFYEFKCVTEMVEWLENDGNKNEIQNFCNNAGVTVGWLFEHIKSQLKFAKTHFRNAVIYCLHGTYILPISDEANEQYKKGTDYKEFIRRQYEATRRNIEDWRILQRN